MPPAPVAKADGRIDFSPADKRLPASYAPFLLQTIIANARALVIAVVAAKVSSAFYAFYIYIDHAALLLFYHFPEKRFAYN